MIAYASRAIRLESVVNAIRKYTRFSASSDLPTDLESICVFWLNKVVQTFLYTIDNECEVYSKQVSFFFFFLSERFIKFYYFCLFFKLNIKCQPHLFISQVDDITKNLANGSILSALILFYTCDTEIDISREII